MKQSLRSMIWAGIVLKGDSRGTSVEVNLIEVEEETGEILISIPRENEQWGRRAKEKKCIWQVA